MTERVCEGLACLRHGEASKGKRQQCPDGARPAALGRQGFTPGTSPRIIAEVRAGLFVGEHKEEFRPAPPQQRGGLSRTPCGQGRGWAAPGQRLAAMPEGFQARAACDNCADNFCDHPLHADARTAIQYRRRLAAGRRPAGQQEILNQSTPAARAASWWHAPSALARRWRRARRAGR